MEYIEKLKAITQNLEKCERVTKHSNEKENQADTLANGLIDIEDSLIKINQQIPKLYLNDLTNEEVDDLILELGEELRHILYHINDTRVYDYLKMDKE
jgi:K+/H+ antiporter YhaU regulatory subunit KhtT